MTRIVICEDSAYDIMERYGPIFRDSSRNGNAVHIFCGNIASFDKLQAELPGTHDNLSDVQLRVGIPTLDILAEISLSSFGQSQKSLLSLYDRWIKTKSNTLYRLLAQQGILPIDPGQES